MTMIVITIEHIARFLVKVKLFAKLSIMLLCIVMLSGCLGGTVAQQIARSIATSVADKSVARAMGVEEEQEYSDAQYAAAEKLSSENAAVQRGFTQAGIAPTASAINHQRAAQLQATEPDELTYMLATASFLPVKPIAEPLPTETSEPEAKLEVIQSNQLVRVELFNLLIGAEKKTVYEEARLIGATNLPQKNEWKNWQVGVGAIEHSKKIITFLIPPEFGKLPSGAISTVEIAGAGELSIARYEPENLRHKRPAIIKQAQGF